MKKTIFGTVLLLLFVAAGRDVSSEDSDAPKIPSACSQTDLAKYGQPVMFSGRRDDPVVFGVSTPRNHFKRNEEIHVYIWLSNGSTHSYQYYACCEATFLDTIQVVDSKGHRLSSAPERKARESGHPTVRVCSCSTWVDTAPGSCAVIDSGTLNRRDTAYDIPPGTYTIVESDRSQSDSSHSRTNATAANRGLAITVEE